jgi:ABC-type uncharacterized transport system substrate-binding protein
VTGYRCRAGDANRPRRRPWALSPSPADAAQPCVEAFEQGLHEYGYWAGQNIAVRYRFAEGNDARVSDLAADLVGQAVSVIVVEGGPAALAAREIASTVPLIFAVAADPVGTGLVASITREAMSRAKRRSPPS